MTTRRIGTAGWIVPKDAIQLFASEGTHLSRYATGLNCVEINSTFYRPHRPATWQRWAASVPFGFRFAVKAPKAITHEAALRRCSSALAEFVSAVSALGDKLGPLLFQLPPKQVFDPAIAEEFLIALRELHSGPVAFEPRHPSWFTAEAATLLRHFQIARVAADPARIPEAARPGGWPGLRYFRLHGSPRTYYSRYDAEYLTRLAETLQQEPPDTDLWCIFDNTALGAAIHNARDLDALLAL